MEEEKIKLQERKNTGLIYEIEKPQDYLAGTNSPLTEPPIIFPSGHGWHDATIRAKSEMQFNRHFDSYACTLYATAKCLVAYLDKVYGVETTISEMFNAFYAGVVQGRGTTVRQALESFRTKGWVKDEEYPFTADTTAKQFFSQPPITIQIRAKGRLTEWIVRWEQLDYSGNVPHDKIIEALKHTPVICSGFAWASYYGEGIYRDYNHPANHCFPVDDWSTHKDYDLIAYDSYPQDNQYDDNSEDVEFEKKLAKDFRIWSAHRIWCEKKNNSLNIFKSMWNNFVSYVVEGKGVYSFFIKKDKDGIFKKQIIDENNPNKAVKAILTLMRENGLSKMMKQNDVEKMPNKNWF